MHSISIELKGYRAILASAAPYVYFGTTGSRGNETLRITRGAGWEGLTVKAVFWPSGIEVLVPESGEVEVPWEVTAQPLQPQRPGKIVFQGVDETGNRVLVTHDLAYKVSVHSPADGTSSGTPTPSVWVQWVADASGVVSEAAEIVEREAALVEQISAGASQAAASAANASTSATKAATSAQAAAQIADIGVDATLTTSGAAADAQATGAAIGSVKSNLALLINKILAVPEMMQEADATLITGYEANTYIEALYENAKCELKRLAVNSGEIYYVTCTTAGNAPMAVFANDETLSSASYLGYQGVVSQSAITTYTDEMVVIPEGCTYVFFNHRADKSSEFTVKTITFKQTSKSLSTVKYYDDVLTVCGDVSLEFKQRGVNRIFMLSNVIADGTTKAINTDWVSPFVFSAVNDPVDGTSQIHTGGNHGSDGSGGGNATARTDSVKVYVDGSALAQSENTICARTVCFEVVNYIGAWNTVSDGTYRDSLKEIDRYDFDGKRLKVSIELEALEDIQLTYYHGLQTSGYSKQAMLIGGNGVTFETHDFTSNYRVAYIPDYVIVEDDNGNTVTYHVDNVGIMKTSAYDSADRFGMYTYGKTGYDIVKSGTQALNRGDKTICTGWYDFGKTPSF
jgi:hypothetical protein